MANAVGVFGVLGFVVGVANMTEPPNISPPPPENRGTYLPERQNLGTYLPERQKCPWG